MTQHPRYTSALVAIQEREAGRESLRQWAAMGSPGLPREPEAAVSRAVLPSNITGARAELYDARANHLLDDGMKPATADYTATEQRILAYFTPDKVAVELTKKERLAQAYGAALRSEPKVIRNTLQLSAILRDGLAHKMAQGFRHDSHVRWPHLSLSEQAGWRFAALALNDNPNEPITKLAKLVGTAYYDGAHLPLPKEVHVRWTHAVKAGFEFLDRLGGMRGEGPKPTTIIVSTGPNWTAADTEGYAHWNAANGGPSKEEYARRRAEHGPAIGEVAAAMHSAVTGCAKTFEYFEAMAKEVQQGWLYAAAELLAGSLSAPMDLTAGNIYRAYWSKVFPRKALRAYADWDDGAKSIWHKAVEGGRAVIRGSVLDDNKSAPTTERTIEQRALLAYNAYNAYFDHKIVQIVHFSVFNQRSQAGWVAFVHEVDRLRGRGLTEEYIAAAARERQLKMYHHETVYKPSDWDDIDVGKKEAWVKAVQAAL